MISDLSWETPQNLWDVPWNCVSAVQLSGAVLVLWGSLDPVQALSRSQSGGRSCSFLSEISLFHLANQLGLCRLYSMPVFGLRGTEDVGVWLWIPLIGAGHCLADFSLVCVQQKAGLGCSNIFIFNVELKRKKMVLSLLLIPIFWIWVFFIISSKLLIMEGQLIADFCSWLSSVNATPRHQDILKIWLW